MTYFYLCLLAPAAIFAQGVAGKEEWVVKIAGHGHRGFL